MAFEFSRIPQILRQVTKSFEGLDETISFFAFAQFEHGVRACGGLVPPARLQENAETIRW